MYSAEITTPGCLIMIPYLCLSYLLAQPSTNSSVYSSSRCHHGFRPGLENQIRAKPRRLRCRGALNAVRHPHPVAHALEQEAPSRRQRWPRADSIVRGALRLLSPPSSLLRSGPRLFLLTVLSAPRRHYCPDRRRHPTTSTMTAGRCIKPASTTGSASPEN